MDINDVFPDFWDWRNFIIAAKAQGKLKSWSRPSTFDTSGTGYEAAGDGVVEYAGKRWCISIKNGGKSPYRIAGSAMCRALKAAPEKAPKALMRAIEHIATNNYLPAGGIRMIQHVISIINHKKIEI